MLKNKSAVFKLARQTLDIEAKSISNLKKYINDDFYNCMTLIGNTHGRVVISGIGKSAIVAQKLVATFNSTGTPSIFMHAADAIHGDLGIIQKNDIVICISKSGDTAEIKVLLPLLKNWGNRIIALCGNSKSYLALQADYFLNTHVDKEACPNNLAPTSSSAAQLAMGDALAVCLLNSRGFTQEDFAKFHPGGSLGKRLYLKVQDIYPSNPAPRISPDAGLKEIIIEISSNRLGAAAVMKNNKLAGIITDGDLRRMMEKRANLSGIKAKDIMSAKPKTADKSTMAAEALRMMQKHNIMQLIITDKGDYVGMIHLHDLIREGLV